MLSALVTGGSRGIGLELCQQLAGEGWQVFLGARNPASVAQTAKAFPKIIPVQLDVDNPETIDSAYSFIAKKTSTLDLLVNNAGIFLDHEAGVLKVDPA